MVQKRKTVIWGTGNVASHLPTGEKKITPAFYIDNDSGKAGTLLNGKKIYHPSQIENWKKLYIILAMDNCASVKQQMRGLDLQEGTDFVWYRDWIFDGIIDEFRREAEQFLKTIDDEREGYTGKRLIFGDFLAFDKGVCSYVNELETGDKGYVLMSEAAFVSEGEARRKLRIPVLRLPKLLTRNMYLKNRNGSIISTEFMEYVAQYEYLQEAAANLRMGYPDMLNNYEYAVCYYADIIVKKIVSVWKPIELLAWNEFYAFHSIIKSICESIKVPVRYMEFGNIPGTIICENVGQMGESIPAREPDKFMKIPVTDEEYGQAQQLIEQLYKTRLNRNVQPKNNQMMFIQQKIKKDRPVVFYAGQNDNASGMQPYTDNTKEYHSPVFHTSDEAAIYLAGLCEEKDWNFVYKPHPMMVQWCDESLLPRNVILVNEIDINDLIDFSDVVITILSTVSYIALIRKKPTVMLGYTQLKGKGCTYEAFKRSDVETSICSALDGKRKKQMQDKFVRHIVQLMKYHGLPLNDWRLKE